MSIDFQSEVSPKEVLGIDIGGTGIKAAPVNTETGTLLADVVKVPTLQPAIPGAIMGEIGEVIKTFEWKGPVGCGFPAVVKKGVTLSAANVAKEWIGYNALAALEALCGYSASMINDADAAALAEMKFGAGKPYNGHGGGTVLLVTLGTGIGSALFVDGHLVPNTELGHIEIYGIDAEKRAATGVKVREGLSWEAWGMRVNKYLQTIEYLLSPDVFIIGGGVSESCEKFFPYLELQARTVSATLENEAGIIGAALGVFECATEYE